MAGWLWLGRSVCTARSGLLTPCTASTPYLLPLDQQATGPQSSLGHPVSSVCGRACCLKLAVRLQIKNSHLIGNLK